jgi:acyl-CoA synthetase (NDP forming)
MSKSEIEFNSLFYPKTIAIVGASKNKIGGSKYYFALLNSGFIKDPSNVFLINPKFTELHGQRVYKSLHDPDLPKPIDLVIIAVPAPVVPKVVVECDGVAKFAVIYSSGFGEAGRKDLDVELKAAIESNTMTRFIGPNCLGIINPYSKLSIYPNWELYPGNISYIAMSGGTMARLYFFLISLNLGFNNVISIGNTYDLSISDFIDYFNEDEKTKTIALYLESITDGRRFMKTAQKTTPNKPIVLWKGGRSEKGIKAAFSHTGGLAGSNEVWIAMCKQSGILLADHFELFLDLTQIANIRPITPHNLNVAIVVCGGGLGVEFTDVFESQGLNIPDLSVETKEKLSAILPPVNTNFNNPVDLGEYGYHPAMFAKALKIVMQDENIGSVVFVREPERFKLISKLMEIPDPQQMTIDSLKVIISEFNKPIFCNPSANSARIEDYQDRHSFELDMIEAGIPIINYATNIPKIIMQLYYYGRFLKNSKK